MAPIIFAFRPAHFRTAPSVLIAVALLATVAGCQSRHTVSSQAREHLDFNQDVQPILASNCFSCHGPDPEMRKANLRLDLEESAFRKRPGKPDAIVPGHPESSELIRRIESKDPHYLMPQSAAGRSEADEAGGDRNFEAMGGRGCTLPAALGI